MKKAYRVLFGVVLFLSTFVTLAMTFFINKQEEWHLKDFDGSIYQGKISENAESLFTDGTDTQISKEFESTYIRTITIRFSQKVNTPWKLQVFYADQDEQYSELKSVIYTASGRENCIKIYIGENASKVRIDFGDEANNVFVIDSIRINPIDYTTIVFTFAVTFSLFFALGKLVLCYNENKYNGIIKNNVAANCFSIVALLIIILIWLMYLRRGENIFEKLFIASDVHHRVTFTFTTLNFIFIFLPLCLLGYYLIKKPLRNAFLVTISLIYYSAGEPVMIWLLMLSILINYIFGLLLAKEWNIKFFRPLVLVAILIWNFGLLYYYKYYIFTLENINLFFGTNLALPNIIQPLGISFFTFRTVSFCLDIYWKTVPRQNSFINVALYICFFPQVSMGPISKYNDFSSQLSDRTFDLDLFIDGIKRIIVGWAKKLIIANNIASTVDFIFEMGGSERTVGLAWIGILGYLLQLYYDFSGYSDIAIGIGKLFGFITPENFNYPYVSKSIVEYWSRWHITLGTWLKNYLYIPIFRACQEKSISRGSCNILALLGVWLFAGIWHGTGWNYVCYGLYYFTFIVLERLIEDHKKKRRKRLKLKKKPESMKQRVLAHIYFFTVLIFGQLLFRSTDLLSFCDYCSSLFGLCGNKLWNSQTYYYFLQSITLMITGWLFAFPVAKIFRERISGNLSRVLICISTPVLYACLLVISIAFAVTGTYQSFIYFQF